MSKSKFSSQRIGAFKDQHFDNQFMRALGLAAYGAGVVGEIYYVSSRMKGRADFDLWVKEWSAIAKQVEDAAWESLENGHVVSAREGFLRASAYYRSAEFHIFSNDPRRYGVWKKSKDCFIEYGKLSNYGFEAFEIPFEGQKLPAYFIRPDKAHKKRPTIIVFGGGDSSGEESFFYIGKAALDRDYNVLQVEGPGQKGTVHMNPGSVFRPDYEVPIKKVVDYLYEREEVDMDKLAIYGLSYGGYIALRGAMFDDRIKACIANPGWLDMHTFFRKGLPKFTQNMSPKTAGKILEFFSKFWKLGEFALDTFKIIYGLDHAYEVFDTIAQYNNEGLEEKIDCPLLLLAGEGEGDELMRQQRELLAKSKSPNKKLHIFTEAEGADAHCMTNNLVVHNQVIFDWLDDVFNWNLQVMEDFQ